MAEPFFLVFCGDWRIRLSWPGPGHTTALGTDDSGAHRPPQWQLSPQFPTHSPSCGHSPHRSGLVSRVRAAPRGQDRLASALVSGPERSPRCQLSLCGAAFSRRASLGVTRAALPPNSWKGRRCAKRRAEGLSEVPVLGLRACPCGCFLCVRSPRLRGRRLSSPCLGRP